jgi:hypothetical protein
MTEADLLRSWDEELANWRECGIDRSMRGDGSDIVPPEAIASVEGKDNWVVVTLKTGQWFFLLKGVIRRPVVDAEYVRQELTKRGVDWSVFNDLPTAAMKGTGNA